MSWNIDTDLDEDFAEHRLKLIRAAAIRVRAETEGEMEDEEAVELDLEDDQSAS